MVRAEVDATNERIQKKIRTSLTQKVPNLLIIGDNEVANGTVTLRRYGIEAQENMTVAAFTARILQAIRTRAVEFPVGA
jgi:threonyl-tRNA synthetase